jgi:hypothetical protein
MTFGGYEVEVSAFRACVESSITERAACYFLAGLRSSSIHCVLPAGTESEKSRLRHVLSSSHHAALVCVVAAAATADQRRGGGGRRRRSAGAAPVEAYLYQADADGGPRGRQKYDVEPAVVEVEVDVSQDLCVRERESVCVSVPPERQRAQAGVKWTKTEQQPRMQTKPTKQRLMHQRQKQTNNATQQHNTRTTKQHSAKNEHRGQNKTKNRRHNNNESNKYNTNTSPIQTHCKYNANTLQIQIQYTENTNAIQTQTQTHTNTTP